MVPWRVCRPWSQNRIIFMRSRIRICIKVKSQMRIRIGIKVKREIRIRIKAMRICNRALSNYCLNAGAYFLRPYTSFMEALRNVSGFQVN